MIVVSLIISENIRVTLDLVQICSSIIRRNHIPSCCNTICHRQLIKDFKDTIIQKRFWTIQASYILIHFQSYLSIRLVLKLNKIRGINLHKMMICAFPFFKLSSTNNHNRRSRNSEIIVIHWFVSHFCSIIWLNQFSHWLSA